MRKGTFVPNGYNESRGKAVFDPCIKMIKIIKDNVENNYQNQTVTMEDNREYAKNIKYKI